MSFLEASKYSVVTSFTKFKSNDWKCPTCNSGVLKICSDSFFEKESADSLKDHNQEAFDYDWVQLVFSCLLKCSNTDCNEVVSCTGNGVIKEHGRYGGNEYIRYFMPISFYPNLKFFELPPDTPDEVCELINRSFDLVLKHPDSSLNNLRKALEVLLTELDVPLLGKKQKSLSLHRRIHLIPDKLLFLKDLLLAIKWQGNAGSHGLSTLTVDDVFNVYEIFNVVLLRLYVEDPWDKVNLLAQSINKKFV